MEKLRKLIAFTAKNSCLTFSKLFLDFVPTRKFHSSAIFAVSYLSLKASYLSVFPVFTLEVIINICLIHNKIVSNRYLQ